MLPVRVDLHKVLLCNMTPHCIHLRFPWYGLTLLLTALKTVTYNITNNDILHLFLRELLEASTCYILKGIIT